MSTGPNETAAPGTVGQEVFGPYLVYERLGVGGMATVHRAREHGIEGFERIVALKRLLPHLAEDASFVRSFVREAKLASLLRHANIVQLYELGRVGTTYFISMEFIDGRDVRRILRQARKVTGPPTVNVTLALLIQLCDALDYAHSRHDDDTGEPLHIVHRDVSPSNLLVTKSGHLKIIDFGIAKAQASHLRTATGRVKGKLAYMAPEAIAGKELDARSDIFSAGVIAHELLTARPLFASKNEYQTLLKVQKGDILPPSTFNQACPPELDAIVLKALARDPDQRWSSAAEMRDALHEVRIRYAVSATNREVASWCEWSFAVEAPANNFSGPMMTDSLGGAPSQSRSPLQMPLPAAAESDAVPRLGMTPLPTRSRPEDEDAEVAWGVAQEHDSGQPVVLEDVPDHAGRARAPSVAGQLAASADEPQPGWQKTLVGTGVRRRETAPPVTFPYGSSNDALGRSSRASGAGGRSGTHAVEAPPDTEPHERVDADAPAFGAGMLERQPARSPRALIIGVVAAALVGAALFLAFGRGGDRKPEATTTAQAAPVTGTLKFIVEPADAVVKIAGLPPHTGSDWVVELEAGVFQVSISRDGYKSWATQIELSGGETQTVRVVLEEGVNASVATLAVTSSPSGMTVLLDGEELGRTPLSKEIPPGGHTVALRDNGEIKWKEWFTATANTKHEFNPDTSVAKVRERAAREQQRVAIVPEKRRSAAPAPTAPAAAPTPAPAAAKTVEPEPAPVPEPPAPKVIVPAPAPEKAAAVAPPPPPARSAGPVTVPPTAVKRTSGELGKIRAVVRQGETLPSMLAAKICIDTSGKVTSVRVMTKASTDLARRIASEIESFRYTPYRQRGAAVPACFAETFRIK